MLGATNFRLRRVWMQTHLWLGLGLAILLVPISLSGAALVWHDQLDALINPGRYAVTAGPSLPPSQLIGRATVALERGFQPIALRMPDTRRGGYGGYAASRSGGMSRGLISARL